jgi:hypothetical protein
MRITGAGKIIEQLKDLSTLGARENKVDVGYKDGKAVYVHENLMAAHGELFNQKYADKIAAGREHARRPQEQAKFLEGPSRKYKSEIGAIITQVLKNKKGLDEALLRAAKFLLEKSLEIVPTDTEELRNSAFIKVY